ncbi:MAG: dethiobiotin synthase [Verrucomicrobiae bacterium]|nr:dethiobiotin synthase [Verrucomicrobiae bacterium]
MKPPVIFVTGTDTGAGKTVFAAHLVQHLRHQGCRVVGLKPLCSGRRDDARLLRAAAGKVLSLDEVNPWHFRAPLAPLLAARKESRRVQLSQVVKHVRTVSQRYEWVVVEGAGGLLSPLGEDFDSRDLIVALQALPVVVCPNRLGAVNQARLVLDALPVRARTQARVVLMSPPRSHPATRSNARLLAEFFATDRICEFPWLGKESQSSTHLRPRPANQVARVLGRWFSP